MAKTESSPARMDVSVIIVTYNSASCIEACLKSVLAQTGVSAEILVVDNASADNTAAIVKNFKAQLLANRENVGYGPGNNQGFAASSGRYIYLLNPDSELMERDALAGACQAMAAHERWGMAGTRVVSADGTGETQPATSYPGQRHVRRDFSKLPGQIAWILGASVIVKREMYTALGGFDPGFFLYSEETDFCLRAREAGHEIGYIGEVTVRHIGGKSEYGQDPYDVTRRKMTGLHRFWQKHYSAEDAVGLVRRDLRRAHFRMSWYGLLARLQGRQSRAWRKSREYRAIWESSAAFLSGTGG